MHAIIVGRTRSGKTTLVRALLELTARAVILDRKRDYTSIEGATVTESLDEALTLLTDEDFFGKPFKLVLQARDPEDCILLAQAAGMMQEENVQYGPLLVVTEEASAYSETHAIHPVLRELFNSGQHFKLSILTVIQFDTDIHRVTRANSEFIITCAQHKLSGDMQRYFDYDSLGSLVSLRKEYRFPPEQGINFLVYPDDTDLYEEWYREFGYWYDHEKEAIVQIPDTDSDPQEP